jgi:hypothetical protein
LQDLNCHLSVQVISRQLQQLTGITLQGSTQLSAAYKLACWKLDKRV